MNPVEREDPEDAPDDIDPGEPVTELAEYRVSLPPDFLVGLQERIDARERNVRVSEFSLRAVVQVFREYGLVVLTVFVRPDPRGERRS